MLNMQALADVNQAANKQFTAQLVNRPFSSGLLFSGFTCSVFLKITVFRSPVNVSTLLSFTSTLVRLGSLGSHFSMMTNLITCNVLFFLEPLSIACFTRLFPDELQLFVLRGCILGMGLESHSSFI